MEGDSLFRKPIKAATASFFGAADLGRRNPDEDSFFKVMISSSRVTIEHLSVGSAGPGVVAWTSNPKIHAYFWLEMAGC